ncbi:hypothetical protein K1719_025623 [Acacia pycnantha]|nr:hypothetical protein K1719_025623 [Acacia pycnantha]
MIPTKPVHQYRKHLVNQVLVAVIQNRAFDAHLAAASASANPNAASLWTVDVVSEVLRSIPRYFFQSSRSIGRQGGFRHRAPLKQRKVKEEEDKLRKNVLVLGPAAYRDPQRVRLGLGKAIEFYYWVEAHFGFTHNETTCREMACVFAKG